MGFALGPMGRKWFFEYLYFKYFGPREFLVRLCDTPILSYNSKSEL